MRLKRGFFFWLLRILTLFIMGMLVAVIITLSQINMDVLRGNVLGILQNSTGLPVEIDGAISWNFSLRPSVEINDVRVANADWAKNKYAFKASSVDVTLDLLSLFQDKPTIENIKIYNAQINLEQNAAGQYSVVPVHKESQNNGALNETSDNAELQSQYPFRAPVLGAVEIKNLKANITGNTYSLAGLKVAYSASPQGREYTGWIKSDVVVLPFIVSFSEYNEERKVYPLRVALSTGGDALIANVALEGTSLVPIDFVVKGDIPDIAEFGKILSLDIADMPMMKINIAGGWDRKKLTLWDSSVAIRGHALTLSGGIDWANKIPDITLSVKSKYINLADLFPDVYKKKRIKPNRPLNAFKNVSLFGTEFLKFNLVLKTDIDNFIVYRDLNLANLKTNIVLKNGRMRLDSDLVFADGRVQLAANAGVDSAGRIYAQVGGVGQNISTGKMLAEIKIDNLISGLGLNFETFLEANGRNLTELMSTVTGPVKIYSVSGGTAHPALVEHMYGGDFLTGVRHSIEDLFRSEKKYKSLGISCVSLNAKLRDGVIDTQNGVAAQTGSINLRLAGSLDLGKEKMKLFLSTVPVRGLKLSLTSNVVNSIEIEGSLAEPVAKISGSAMAGSVASATGLGLLLTPFTGGIGFVAGAGVGLIAGDLLENWLADDKPCQTALEKGAPVLNKDPAWLNVPVAELVADIFNEK